MKKLFSIFLLTLIIPLLRAQSEHQEHDHFHQHEISIASAPAFFFGEEAGSVAWGLHAEYAQRLGEKRWALGAAYEHLWDDHQHRTYGLNFQYSPGYHTHLSFEPGITTELHDGVREWIPTFHMEFAYEWEIGFLDVGPYAEVAVEPHAQHLSAGLHVALPF